MRTQTEPPLKKRRSAFTLIEIMVATVIMVILVGLVIQITSEVLKVWNRSSGKLSANAEARIAMDLLTQDLETAVFRNNGLRWLEANTVEMPSVAGHKAQTVNLILFSPALDRPSTDRSDVDIPGDICAVQYQLVYQDPVNGGSGTPEDNMYALHRRVIDPSTTFNNLMGDGNQDNFDWASAAVPPATGVDMEYLAPERPENYLAGHIANFRVDFYVVDQSGDPVKVPSPIKFGGKDSGGVSTATVGANSTIASTRYPLAYAEISLTVLSGEGTALLQNLTTPGRGGTGYKDDPDGLSSGEQVVREHGEVYTRRVNFLARPL